MKFSLEATDANQIHAYDDSQIIINPGKRHYPIQQQGNGLLITPEHVIEDFTIGDPEQITDDEVAFLQTFEPEVIIFTAGLAQHYLLVSLPPVFAKNGIGIESMAIGAACRTYNLLVLEGRRVILVISP